MSSKSIEEIFGIHAAKAALKNIAVVDLKLEVIGQDEN